MDLIVISNGVELNVSGVTEETTCLQIVYALAHATGQKGKFVLVAYLDGHVRIFVTIGTMNHVVLGTQTIAERKTPRNHQSVSWHSCFI